MKKLVFLIAVAILVFGINSCQKDKDGIYNPKDKISQVHAEAKFYDEDGDIYFTMPKQVTQTWTWKKNQLQSIAVQNGTYTYTYDGKQISKINAGVSTMTFHYDGVNLTKMEVQNTFQSILITILERDADKRITKMRYESSNTLGFFDKSFEEYKTNYSEIKDLINFGFSNQVADILELNLEKQYKTDQTKRLYFMNFFFTYTGDNVTKLTLSEDDYTDTYHYTYDNKPSPFYQFHTRYSDILAYPMGLGFSKNNILSYYAESDRAVQAYA